MGFVVALVAVVVEVRLITFASKGFGRFLVLVRLDGVAVELGQVGLRLGQRRPVELTLVICAAALFFAAGLALLFGYHFFTRFMEYKFT